MKVASTILLFLSMVNAATNSDFLRLQSSMKVWFAKNPQMIPLAVRLSYHDLLYHQSPVGAGCIEKASFQRQEGNAGFPVILDNYRKFQDLFKSANFAMGDVIAFGGKVAVEAAYPCLKIKFQFGRPSCGKREPILRGGSTAPGPNLARLSHVLPHASYLGFSQKDYAVLTIGAHAMKNAKAHGGVSGFDGILSGQNSLKAYLDETFNNVWTVIRTNFGPRFMAKQSLMRLASDLLYMTGTKLQEGRSITLAKRKKDKNVKGKGRFPITISGSAAEGTERKAILNHLRNLDGDTEFGRVFERMLAISGGTANQPFVESSTLPESCSRIQKTTTTNLKAATTNESTAALVAKALVGQA